MSTLLLILIVVAIALSLVVWWGWAPDLEVDALVGKWAQPPSFFVEQAGMSVHVRVEGPDHPEPIVLLHGTGANLYTWEAWTRDLSHTRRVIRFDRPGFGLTGPDPSGNYGMEHATELTIDLLDRLGVNRFVLVGSSSGGRLAWHVALRAPDRAAGLVLVAAAGYPRTTPLPAALRFAGSTLGGWLLSYLMPAAMVAKGIAASYGDPSRLSQATVEASQEISRRAGVRRAMGETLRQAATPDASGTIPGIRVPTLILWGDRDTTIERSEAERFHRDIPGSTLEILGGMGHLPHEEDPATSILPLKRFLGDDS